MADGLSARELAVLAGVSLSHPNMIETGRRENPTADVLGKIAPILGVSLEWLVNGSGEEPTKEAVSAAVQRAKAARAVLAGRAA
jgi:transcriptional regulator with XRE-family HTH domain